MKENVAGHEAFTKAFQGFETYIKELAAAPQPEFSPKAFREMIYSFTEPLFQHLQEEIETLRPAELHRAGVTEAQLKKAEKDMESYVIRTTSLFDIPLTYVNGDHINGAW